MNIERKSDLETSRAFFDVMASAICTIDINGIITYYNPAASLLWGIEPIIGSDQWCGSLRIFQTDGTPLAHEDCPMAICLKSGQGVSNHEIIVERPDGSRKNVLVSPQPLHDGHGHVIGAINTLNDITGLRESERARDTNAQLTKSILRHSKDCIKLLNLDGTLRSINPCGCTSLELASESEAVGKNYFDFWQPADRDAALAAAETSRRTGSGRFRADYTSSSGKVTTWDEMMSLITDLDGTPTGFLVISRDMTRELQDAQAKNEQLAQEKALADIGAMAVQQVPFQEFMERTIVKVADALQVPLAKILPYADQADHLWLAAGVGWQEGLVGNASVGTEKASQAGYTLSVEGPVIVEDLIAEKRFDGPPLLVEHGVRSGMSVTISGTGTRPFGVIGIHDTKVRQFDESQITFLETVANLIASVHRQNEFSKRQTLLVREIAHRSGNMLQFVNSIFNQTVRNSENLADAKVKFEERLAQMSKSNLLISSDGWTKSNVSDLVAQTLEPFQDRIDSSGRDVMLPAELCFDLGMVLHELATNSTKYGALSGAAGRVCLIWSIEPQKEGRPDFVLTWKDQKRQSNAAIPGTGFGTKLIKQLIESKWSGRVTTELEPEFCCRLSMPFPETIHSDASA